jgi:hypothetical protein
MQHLGFEIKVITLLAGVGGREELSELVFEIIENGFKVAKLLRFDPADQTDHRRFNLNGKAARI